MLLDATRLRASELETDPFLRLAVGSITLEDPVFVPASMTASEAARTMREHGVSACLVGDAAQVAGILTEKDVVAQASRGTLDVRVEEMMTAGLITVRGEELVFEAFSTMIRHGIRRLVVVDENERPRGLLKKTAQPAPIKLESLKHHTARDFDPLTVNPAQVRREERGHGRSDVLR